MKKSILALLLAVLMVASLLPAAAMAQKVVAKIGDAEYTDLATALKAAQDGDVVEIMPGEYELVGDNGRPAFTIWNAVSIKGSDAGSTIITGRIEYGVTGEATVDCDTITVEGITLKPDGSNNDLGICWSNDQSGNANNTLSGYDLVVKNCILDGWKYAVGVNSNAATCKLTVTNTAFDDVFCAASVQEGSGNEIKSFVAADGSNMQMVAQVWGESYNAYYDSYDKLVADTERENPTLDGNNGGSIVWPAAAILNSQYYGTIQAAVDAATSGATITVLPGTYDEVVTFGGKSLTIKAQNYAYANGWVETDTSKLSTFAGTFNTYKNGSFNADQKIVIEGFNFTGNGLKVGNTNYNGVGTLEVRNCKMTFGKNLTAGTGNPYGLLNYFVKVSDDTPDAYATVVVEDNYISGTPEFNIIPIQLWHVKSATVKNNVINLSGDNGLEAISISVLSADANVNVENNNISNVNGGVYVTTWKCGDGTGNTPFTGNVNVNDNTFTCGGTPIFVGFPDGATDDYAAFYGNLSYEDNTNNGETIVPEVGQKPGATAYYEVTYYPNNGGDKMIQLAMHNETITLPAAPSKSGYAFLGWSDGTTTYAAGAQYTVTADTTFTASWVRHPDTEYVPEPEEPEEPEVPEFPFYDVPTSAWYYTAVKYVYDNKLMDGVDTYVFAPNDTLTRAMVWTIIARMSGVDTTGGNTWYAKAQEWVITNGISDGENPTAAITRQELVTMLYRYAQIKGYDVSVGEDTNILSYVDATSISEYAMSAFQWACGSGLTEGDENGALTPLATATRAQAAAMIMRFLSK